MPDKFAGLTAAVETPFRVELIHPVTERPIVDKEGNPAYVDVLSVDSAEGNEFDRERRKQSVQRAMRGLKAEENDDEITIAKIARLTKAWHLVDVFSGDAIDWPCTEENARELYSADGRRWLFRQVLVGAGDTANFMLRSSKT